MPAITRASSSRYARQRVRAGETRRSLERDARMIDAAAGVGAAARAGTIAIQQRSASSNTRCAAHVQPRQRASLYAFALARTCSAASPNALSAAYMRSAHSSSSASSARGRAHSPEIARSRAPSSSVVSRLRQATWVERRQSRLRLREPLCRSARASRPAKNRSWSAAEVSATRSEAAHRPRELGKRERRAR